MVQLAEFTSTLWLRPSPRPAYEGVLITQRQQPNRNEIIGPGTKLILDRDLVCPIDSNDF
jgi:hypothetical protein